MNFFAKLPNMMKGILIFLALAILFVFVAAIVGGAKKILIKFGLVKDPAKYGPDGKPLPPPPPPPLPNNGSGIPSGWDPLESAVKIQTAIKGWGTDEQAIYDVFTPLTPDQQAAVIGRFEHEYYSYWNATFWDIMESELNSSEMNMLTGIIHIN